MDLQLAYLAAPQSAAQATNAQTAPQAAQAASQSAFVAQLQQREESVAEAAPAEGSVIRTDADGQGQGGEYTPQERRHTYAAPNDTPLGLAGDGEHFIDVTV